MDFQKLKALESRVSGCKRCSLYASCKGKVFGDIGENTKVIFLGEAPGKEEDEIGRPFVGPAGNLLRSWIKVIGLKNSEFSILNVVKCRPPYNRVPLEQEMTLCGPWLDQQVEHIECNKMVLLGRVACSRIIPNFDGTILKHVGEVHQVADIQCLIMPHPSFVLRGGNRYPVPLDKLQKFIGD